MGPASVPHSIHKTTTKKQNTANFGLQSIFIAVTTVMLVNLKVLVAFRFPLKPVFYSDFVLELALTRLNFMFLPWEKRQTVNSKSNL
jgi:hypothetical protein